MYVLKWCDRLWYTFYLLRLLKEMSVKDGTLKKKNLGALNFFILNLKFKM